MGPAFSESEHRERLDRARQALRRAGLDGCICIAPEHLYYLGGYDEGRAFKRAQVPDDLVGTVIFLLSDASGFITGQTINVDGGRSMH